MTPLEEAKQIFNFFYFEPNVTIEGAKSNAMFLVNKMLDVVKVYENHNQYWEEVKNIISKAEYTILNYPEEPQY